MEIVNIPEKDKFINKVNLPNFIQNRFDIKYGNEYELYKITEYNNDIYIPVKILNDKEIELGVWLLEIKEDTFDNFIEFLFNKYKDINKIHAKYILTKYRGLSKLYHYSVKENNFESFTSKLGKSTIKNIKWNINRINKTFSLRIKKYSGRNNIPLDLIKKYFQWKKDRFDVEILDPMEYLNKYFVTDAYEIKFDSDTAASFFIVKINNTAYVENYSYNIEYDKYSLGIIINYLIIKELIESGITYIDIGAGYEDSYKYKLYKERNIVYSGIIEKIDIDEIYNRVLNKCNIINNLSNYELLNFMYILDKKSIYYGNIKDKESIIKADNIIYDNINIVYIEDYEQSYEIVDKIFKDNIDIKAFCIKSSHNRFYSANVFEDTEQILKDNNFILLEISRYKSYSYSSFINNKYKKISHLNTNNLSKIHLDIQKYLESSNFKRNLIKYFVRFRKKEYIHQFRHYIEYYENVFKNINIQDRNLERFMLSTYDIENFNGGMDNNTLCPSISRFNDAIKHIDIKKDYILFDAGSGIGSILYAGHGLFKEVIGCELNTKLYEIANRNLKALKIKNYKLYNKNINDIDIDVLKDVNVLYMANPFMCNTFKNFIKKIVQSLEYNKRELYIIYMNSIYRNYILDSYSNIFKHTKELKYEHYSTDIFENRTEQNRTEQNRTEQNRTEIKSTYIFIYIIQLIIINCNLCYKINLQHMFFCCKNI